MTPTGSTSFINKLPSCKKTSVPSVLQLNLGSVSLSSNYLRSQQTLRFPFTDWSFFSMPVVEQISGHQVLTFSESNFFEGYENSLWNGIIRSMNIKASGSQKFTELQIRRGHRTPFPVSNFPVILKDVAIVRAPTSCSGVWHEAVWKLGTGWKLVLSANKHSVEDSSQPSQDLCLSSDPEGEVWSLW